MKILVINGNTKSNGFTAGALDIIIKHLETKNSDFLFFKTGLPSKLKPDDVADKLLQSADKLILDIENKRKKSFFGRMSFAIDRIIMRNIVFKKNPDAYESIINNWKKKNYIN